MAGYYDFRIERRTTFKRTLGWRVGGLPVDVTGFVVTLEGRKNIAQPTPDFKFQSDEGNFIKVGKADGRIDITLPPATTEAIPSGIYFYWIDINTGDEVQRLLEGRITVKEGSTA